MNNYYIIATRYDLDGFPQSYTVSYDNRATDDFDNFMFFETEKEAQNWIDSPAAKEWVNCQFEIYKVEND